MWPAPCQPIELRRDRRHARLFQLRALPRHGGHGVAPRIAVRMRSARRDAGPGRPPRQPEIARGPAGGLQVVNEIEAAQLAAQPRDARRIEPGRPRIDTHLVEPRAFQRQGDERLGGQQRHTVRAVVRADGGERRERVAEIAQRPEPDDQDAPHATNSRYTASVACCIACSV
ncbi:MAG: hypothetical protein WDN04_21145 [Rhodospirillales bacterium]